MVSLLVALASVADPALGNNYELLVEDAAAPWSQQDGTGFANDVVKAAFAAVGDKVDLTVVPYARCRLLALTGKTVGCFNMSWNSEFRNKIVFAERPLFSVTVEYFVRSDQPRKLRSEDDLRPGDILGIVRGYEYPERLDSLRERGVIFLALRSEEIALKMLAAGRLTSAVLNVDASKTAARLIADTGVEGMVAFAFASTQMGSFLGFSLENPQGLEAKTKFDRGYAEITKNGKLNEIKKAWHM